LVKTYLEYRFRKITDFLSDPIRTQQDVMMDLLFRARDTEWGRRCGFDEMADYRTFADRQPLQEYDDIKSDIQRMIRGEEDVLWPGRTSLYAKSSGTTSDKSKFIPVSQDSLKGGHIKGSWDSVAILYQMVPDARIFADKSLLMGGSMSPFPKNESSIYGDVSAIMLHNMPAIGRPFYAPDMEIALMDDWEQKIEKMARVVKDENITMFGGVPTWTMVLLDKILEITGEEDMSKVWPLAKIYMHGGVNFKPYREQFSNYFSAEDFIYQEIYNASEGFFAVQFDQNDDDMILLLDNGMFYEFVPYQGGVPIGPAIPLQGVEINKEYALVISTNAGLWRYQPGDVVEFTSTFPFKIKIKGRTSQFINAFGEEVMVANTDEALAQTCRQLNAVVSDYSVAPRYLKKNGQGGHEWLIEFVKPPTDMNQFERALDDNLKQINSDYEAKRAHDLALNCLVIQSLPQGTFKSWLKSKNKMGGQHKIPRLYNDRKYVDDILNFASSN
jgi:hypothetical protein